MPYSKNPMATTYDTKRISFIESLKQRNGNDITKDARLVNMMVEIHESPNQDDKEAYIRTRPGTSLNITTAAGEARGIYYWAYSGNTYTIAVVGGGVFSGGSMIWGLSTTTGRVGFSEFVNSVGEKTLILVDGVNGYVFTSPTVCTPITSPDFPTPHLPWPVVLDGYLFLAKPNSQDIYNSDLDDPTAWTVGSYISAEMYPDRLVALTRNNNYIYAVGSSSIEYLYDEGNTTASPLGRHDAAVQQFGALAPNTVVQTEKEVIMVGSSGNGGPSVWTIDGFTATEIGTAAVKAAMAAEQGNIVNMTAMCIRVSNQKLYLIQLSTRTLVYSFTTKLWTEWSTNGGPFAYTYATDTSAGYPMLLHATNGNLCGLSELNYSDHDGPITCTVITTRVDFDSMNNKFLSRLMLVGDIPDANGTDNVVSISWSDNDYSTWSTPRNLDMKADMPALTQLGKTRRRAFKAIYSGSFLFRIEGIEVDYNRGTQ